MKLVRSTEHLRLSGISYPGLPILLSKETKVVRSVQGYLLWIGVPRGRSASRGTAWTYAKQLYDYFSFLEANDLRWDEVPPRGVPSHLAHYRNWSVQTGNRASTINQRLRTVIRFYRWAASQGQIKALPWDIEDI